jgi:NNP family nitrate/nitrite transporter-like MFS transporter
LFITLYIPILVYFSQASNIDVEDNQAAQDAHITRSYDLPVDPNQDDKATKLKICSFQRPHMRTFNYLWWSFFVAFFVWFAIAPLLPAIQETLDLSSRDMWTSNIVAEMGDIFRRFVFGAVYEKYGARIPMGAIQMAMIGLMNILTGLISSRMFIGIAGSSFVVCQCWYTCMFTKEISGIANGLVGGWGTCGGGATQIIMGTGLFPLFKYMFDGDAEKARRAVCIVPAVAALITGIIIITTIPLRVHQPLPPSVDS